jgi:hypothetical protein
LSLITDTSDVSNSQAVLGYLQEKIKIIIIHFERKLIDETNMNLQTSVFWERQKLP